MLGEYAFPKVPKSSAVLVTNGSLQNAIKKAAACEGCRFASLSR